MNKHSFIFNTYSLYIRLINKFRFIVSRLYDPIVRFNFDDFVISLPLSHPLPALLKLYPHYSSNLGRIAAYVCEKYKDDFYLIDIGANIGDTVAILRREAHFPILCIEGNETFFSILKKNTCMLKDIHVENVFIGDKSGHAELNTEIRAGTMRIFKPDINGNRRRLSDAISTEQKIYTEIKRLSEVIEKYSNFSKAKLLKIDTDGFDGFIIRSSTNFIELAKPIIFFEYDPLFLKEQGDDGVSIFINLRESGYLQALMYDEWGKFMFSIDLSNRILIEDIHTYLMTRDKGRYADVCAFHEEDNDLFDEIRRKEKDYYLMV
jgi:FkbM family methyltransferase